MDETPLPKRRVVIVASANPALARSAETWCKRDDLAQIRARISTLTPREFEVFRLVTTGLLNKQIAAELAPRYGQSKPTGAA